MPAVLPVVRTHTRLLECIVLLHDIGSTALPAPSPLTHSATLHVPCMQVYQYNFYASFDAAALAQCNPEIPEDD